MSGQDTNAFIKVFARDRRFLTGSWKKISPADADASAGDREESRSGEAQGST